MLRTTAVYDAGLSIQLEWTLSRSLPFFLLFLAALILAGALGAWYLGPSVVSLAFDDERRNAPYYLVSLVASPDSGMGDGSAAFRSDLAGLVSEDGGLLLWRAVTIQVAEGRVEDEWQHLQLFEFPRGGDLVEMLTSARYRGTADVYPRLRRLILGAADPSNDLAFGSAAVLSLYRVDADATEFAPGARDLASNLGEFGGQLVWDVPVADLDGDALWSRVLLFEFASVRAAERWLRDPATVTHRALIQRGAKGVATLILESS